MLKRGFSFSNSKIIDSAQKIVKGTKNIRKYV
jgi:hypothetical protein